jgi:hypothetical protein
MHGSVKEARQQIIEAANVHRRDRTWRTLIAGAAEFVPRQFTARHINECVCIVRRRRLVEPNVLVAAGFNA